MKTQAANDCPQPWRSWRMFVSRWRRTTRWEFWPTLPIYLPVIPVIIIAALRHRSLAVVMAVNPGMPSGGFVLDSKSAILRELESSGRVAPFELIEPNLSEKETRTKLHEIITRLDLKFPIVLKPDTGERGRDVLIARTEDQCIAYLNDSRTTTLVQRYVPGVEYGVFYERSPSQKKGRISGITHKAATCVIGDGSSSLRRLILSDPRAVCLAPIFFELNADRLDEVIPSGEEVQLNLIGTHSRGSLFLDACEAWTQPMEDAIDQASQHFAGFFFGRYDIRVPSLDSLQKGENFQIVELNGVTSEPTHMYDPQHGVFYAWKCLAAQWWRAFGIAAENRKQGHSPMSLTALLARVQQSRKL